MGTILNIPIDTDLNTFGQNGERDPEPGSFPLEVLPPGLGEYISDLQANKGQHPDYLAAGAIVATSIASGITYELKLSSTLYTPIFYLVLVGNPNANKSGALREALAPLQQSDSKTYTEYQTKLAEWKRECLELRKAHKGIRPEDLPEEPIYRRFLFDNTTPEALYLGHSKNTRGIGLYPDELSGWIKGFDRYNGKGDRERWLTAWNGAITQVDRKTSGSYRIDKTFICVAGTTQPGVLKIFAGEGNYDGFTDRFLFVWPDNAEKPLWSEKEVYPWNIEQYERAINRIIGLELTEEGKSHILILEGAAKEALLRFFNLANKTKCDNAPNDLLKGIHGKFDAHTARLTIALHLLWWAYGEEEKPSQAIKQETIERAILAAEYFRGQSLKVYRKLHESSPVDDLSRDRKGLYEILPDTFTTAEAVKAGESLSMNEKTVKRFLNTRFFKRVKHGAYEKIYTT